MKKSDKGFIFLPKIPRALAILIKWMRLFLLGRKNEAYTNSFI